MKWAFIDYENTGTLGSIDLSSYKKVIVFLGAKQPRIDFGGTFYKKPLNLVVIQMKGISPNNLDFHLSYYLGKCENKAAKEICFDIISNDNGFTPLVAHIKSNGRECNHIKVGTGTTTTSTLAEKLSQQAVHLRPKKVVSLRNYIASQLGISGNEIAIQNHLNQLVTEKILTIDESGVKYIC